MNKTQLSRWTAAKKLFNKLIDTAKLAKSEIWFEDCTVTINCSVQFTQAFN